MSVDSPGGWGGGGLSFSFPHGYDGHFDISFGWFPILIATASSPSFIFFNFFKKIQVLKNAQDKVETKNRDKNRDKAKLEIRRDDTKQDKERQPRD